MGRRFHLRQLLVSVLADVYDVSHKVLAARLGLSAGGFSKQIRSRMHDLKEESAERLLAAIPASPAAVPIVMGCLESLEAVEREDGLAAAASLEIESGVLESSRTIRDALVNYLRRLHSIPGAGYPLPADLDAHRFRAGKQIERLRKVPAAIRSEVVESCPEFHNWALCEKACEESIRQAARNVEEALSWAQLAQEIAGLVEGPQGWRDRLLAYAAAHVANALRVAGELKAAELVLQDTLSRWAGGTDPDRVLDPGSLLVLEAALRRVQQRYEEALSLLEQAVAVSRNPGRVLISKGFVLEVIGEYEEAINVLRLAAPLVEGTGDPRLSNILRLNLANNFCHLGRFREATELINEVRPLVAAMDDRLDLFRILGLEARIAAGLGQPEKAMSLLAEARRRFVEERMFLDVSLLLLEEARLLLKQGQSTEVNRLAGELGAVFEVQGVRGRP